MPGSTIVSNQVTNRLQQKTFQGGMDTLNPDINIDLSSYRWLINARQRFGYVEPIKQHEVITDLPAGKRQGICALGNILIIFIAGRAYYKEDGSLGSWIQISDFFMNPYVERYWTEAVPASYMNLVRKIAENNNIKDPIRLTTDFKVAGTPQCIVVQDGTSQPWIITYDYVNQIFYARVTHTYSQWANASSTTDDREYVPIGRQMKWIEGAGILLVVSQNQDKVYRSVTGRPLDFMVNVDANGNKLASEALGGADSVSFAMDSDTITCLDLINTPNSFVYGTSHNTRICYLDYSEQIFGEPTVKVSARISAGIVNQRSWVELVGQGDYAFVDFEGVISFDAVQQLKFNGRNSIFSLTMSKLLKTDSGQPIKQQDPCCTIFNNYILFNIDTLFGNVIAVYDILLQKWVALDVTKAFKIQEFAKIETTNTTKLYALTKTGILMQMYSSALPAVATMRTRAFAADETRIEHKSQSLRLMFDGGKTDGKVYLQELVDDLQGVTITKDLDNSFAGVKYPVKPPVIPGNKIRVDNPQFVLKDGKTGKKLAYIVKWDNGARLLEFELMTTSKDSDNPQKDNNRTYKNTYGN